MLVILCIFVVIMKWQWFVFGIIINNINEIIKSSRLILKREKYKYLNSDCKI